MYPVNQKVLELGETPYHVEGILSTCYSLDTTLEGSGRFFDPSP